MEIDPDDLPTQRLRMLPRELRQMWATVAASKAEGMPTKSAAEKLGIQVGDARRLLRRLATSGAVQRGSDRAPWVAIHPPEPDASSALREHFDAG
jgi:hypothetical protein